MSAAGLPPPPSEGDVNYGRELNIIIWTFAALTTFAFACRMYSRKYLTRNLAWDDTILGLSMALLYIQCAFVSVAVGHGLGRHMYYLLVSDPLDISNVVKWQLFSEPLGIFGTTIPKIAVTMLLIKLLNPSKLAVAYLWMTNMVLNAVSLVCVITSFTQCTPTSTYWTKQGGHCWNPTIVANLAITQGALSAFTDFNLALFPVTVLWSLQMPWMRKAAVCTLMGFGCLAGIAAIIRTTKLAKLAQQTDFTYSIWTLVLWVAVECCVVITCACIPSMRPIFRKLSDKTSASTFPSLLFSRRNRNSSGGKSYMLDLSPPGSVQGVTMGRQAKITARSLSDGSKVSLKRGPGIRETTDVEVRHSDCDAV
ncbi:hypothetical protein ACEQ8H_006553 [Pleosporales sp. CAS-2024a]